MHETLRRMLPLVQLASDILATTFPALDNTYICRVIQHDSVSAAEARICSEFLPKPGKEMLGSQSNCKQFLFRVFLWRVDVRKGAANNVPGFL